MHNETWLTGTPEWAPLSPLLGLVKTRKKSTAKQKKLCMCLARQILRCRGLDSGQPPLPVKKIYKLRCPQLVACASLLGSCSAGDVGVNPDACSETFSDRSVASSSGSRTVVHSQNFRERPPQQSYPLAAPQGAWEAAPALPKAEQHGIHPCEMHTDRLRFARRLPILFGCL